MVQKLLAPWTRRSERRQCGGSQDQEWEPRPTLAELDRICIGRLGLKLERVNVSMR